MEARVLFSCVEIPAGYKTLMKDAMKPTETQGFSVTTTVGSQYISVSSDRMSSALCDDSNQHGKVIPEFFLSA